MKIDIFCLPSVRKLTEFPSIRMQLFYVSAAAVTPSSLNKNHPMRV